MGLLILVQIEAAEVSGALQVTLQPVIPIATTHGLHPPHPHFRPHGLSCVMLPIETLRLSWIG